MSHPIWPAKAERTAASARSGSRSMAAKAYLCWRPMDDLAGWHDFYVMLGAAAAAITGLIVVAMSLHLRAIARNVVDRGLARGSLIALVAIVILSGVALFPTSLS